MIILIHILFFNVDAFRYVTQNSTTIGTEIMEAYLDPSSKSMMQVFTEHEVKQVMDNAIFFIALIYGVKFNVSQADKNGVIINGNFVFFPYHIVYKLIGDTLYPERVNIWTINEYGFMIRTKDLKYSVYGYYVYQDTSNTHNETIFSISMNLSDRNDIITNVDSNTIVGMSDTNYKYNDNTINGTCVISLKR